MTENKKTLVDAQHLMKSYGKGEGTTVALNDVSFQVYEGEFLAILGTSGSGKSTLLNILGGMDSPDSGSVLVDGVDICEMNDRALTKYRKNTVGFVFQSFNLISELTAGENISLIHDNAADVQDVLTRVGLENRKNSYPSKMSGGEQQRVSIARAVIKRPRMLLCDEPTGALDYETGKKILTLLEHICRREHTTVVMVTHTREIGKMADRTLSMRDGRVWNEKINENPLIAAEIEW